MKYYYDQEFITGFHKPLFGKRRPFIDLISIGIVAEDGRQYSAISSEYNYYDASYWVKENVILPLYLATVSGDARNRYSVDTFHKHFGVPNDTIARQIIDFITEKEDANCSIGIFGEKRINDIYTKVELVGYYSAYDHVLFCSLFGGMEDLPNGFPMFTIDLQQTFEEKVPDLYSRLTGGLVNNMTFKERMEYVEKNHPHFPVNKQKHIAIGDALWTKQFDKFLQEN